MKARRLPSLAGRTCVVTGATSGIGKAAAVRLAALDANLLLVGRNERIGSNLARRLQRAHERQKIEFVRADLSRQRDVLELGDRIKTDCDRVDVLINNAGARYDTYHENIEGIELTFATNHLGHFLLTTLLLDHLIAAPAARVVTVSSGTHQGVTSEDGWYFGRANYDRRLAYAKSKLANVMFAYELARRLRHTHVTSNAVDPGGVATGFARNNGLIPWARHLVAQALKRDLASPRVPAETLVYLAASDEVAGVTGKLFRRNREVESSPVSHDEEGAKRLWRLSVALTRREREPRVDSRPVQARAGAPGS